MTAATQARSLSITINGTDYSQYLLDFSIGFESWQAGSGIVKKSGEISLTAIAGGVSLDPRDNGDFGVGATVTVTWNGAAHPLGGSLLVLAPPTVEPIISDLPVTASNIALKIPVGCALNYYSTNEPDDDASGVDLGTTTNVYTAVKSLLSAAGITDTDLSGPNTIDFPIEKTSGGFVELAGQLYYSGAFPTPGYLYAGRNVALNIEEIKGASLDLDSASTLSMELGVSDREYAPQLDASVPIGTMRAVGVHRKYVRFQTLKTVIDREGGTTTTIETTTYNGEGDADTISRLAGTSGYGSTIKITASQASINIYFARATSIGFSTLNKFFSASNIKYTYTSKSVRGNITFIQDGDRIPSVSTKSVELSSSVSFKIFDENSNLLLVEYSDNKTIASNVSEYFLGITDLITQNIQVTFYEYDSSQNLIKTTEYNGSPRITIAPDDANITDTGVQSEADRRAKMITTESIIITEWEELEKGINKEEKSIQKCRAILQPDFVAGTGLTDHMDYYVLITDPSSYVEVSGAGSAVPPRPEVWSYDLVEETPWEQSATFSQSAKQAVLTVPYPFSPLSLRLIAEVEGEIQWGRSYQYLIECDPTIFASQESPMPIVRVYGAGENRIFLADAIQWFHTATEDFVGFAGIYLGGSGGDSGTGGSQSRVGTISPIIQTIIAEDDGTDASDEDAIALGIILNSVGYAVSYNIEVLATEV